MKIYNRADSPSTAKSPEFDWANTQLMREEEFSKWQMQNPQSQSSTPRDLGHYSGDHQHSWVATRQLSTMTWPSPDYTYSDGTERFVREISHTEIFDGQAALDTRDCVSRDSNE